MSPAKLVLAVVAVLATLLWLAGPLGRFFIWLDVSVRQTELLFAAFTSMVGRLVVLAVVIAVAIVVLRAAFRRRPAA